MHMTVEIGAQAMPARNKLKGGAGHQATPVARRRIGIKGSLTGMQTTPLDQIKPNPRNPKTHSGKQIRQIANSIVGFSRSGRKAGRPARARRHRTLAQHICA